MGHPLPLPVRLAGTDGLCHVFALALARILPDATIVQLHARDRRTFVAHDWPEDEPLELHVLVERADGTWVDAEGAHPRSEMLAKFGIGPGWAYEVSPRTDGLQDRDVVATRRPRWLELSDQVESLLRRFGWDEDGPPACDDRLEMNLAQVRNEVRRDGLPDLDAIMPPGPVASSSSVRP